MEASGSAAARTGWIPRHLTVWSGSELLAAAPLYIKTHSAGEFVFDQAWADVAGRLGLDLLPQTRRHEPVYAADRVPFSDGPRGG